MSSCHSNRVSMRLLPFFLFGVFHSVYGRTRLSRFFQHHKQRKANSPSHTGQMSAGMKRVQRKLHSMKRICTAKTCSKCKKLLESRSGVFSGSARSDKMKNSCNMLVRMPACCPHNVFLPDGF